MPRFPESQQGDQPVSVSLDGAFVGIDARRAADFGDAAAGRVAEAWNTRFKNGHIETRPGCLPPAHFNPPFAQIYGAGIFSDPAGSEWMVAADQANSFRLADGRTPCRIAYPAGVRVNGRVSFLQAFNKLLMFRGPDQDSLIWEGGDQPWFRAPFYQEQERPGYLACLPRVEWGVLMADRVFVPIARDTIAYSDLLEPNRFDLLVNNIRFNAGEDDAIVGACPYQGSRLVVFKDQSIWFCNNVGGDMGGLSVDRLPGKIGCLARESILEIGGDLLWLAHDGVYSLGQTTEGQLRGATLPLSAPIEPILRRCNWGHAHKATATYADGKYWLAVPLDGATENNAILVFDLLTREWTSVDTYAAPPPAAPAAPIVVSDVSLYTPGLGLTPNISMPTETVSRLPIPAAKLLTTDLFGTRSAFLISGRRILALGHGEVDRPDAASERQITTMVCSRGYMLDGLRVKSLRSVAVLYASRDAETSVSVRTDGVNEEIEIQRRRRRDRRRYLTTGQPLFAVNDGAKFNKPHREDYLWKTSDALRLHPATPIPLGVMQDFDHGFVARRLGRSFSICVTSHRGRLKVRGFVAEGLAMGNPPHSRSA